LAQQRLTALVARLSQVVGDLTIHKQRRATTTQDEARASLEAAIAFATRQARDLETTIAQLIDADPLWACLNQAFRSIKGVAGRTVARLMAEMPQIGCSSNKAIAKLAGLAPIADDSGARAGKRHIRGGKAGVRSILYLVADIARRFDPHLALFHQRLTKAGKPKMLVRSALARKLLVILNAKARDARQAFASQS
jgi:transposase